jgi:hypothetical protein
VKLQRKHLSLLQAALLVVLVNVSCNTSNQISNIENICNCLPQLPDIGDYRHNAKHVHIPSVPPPIAVTVSDIIGWPTDPVLPPNQPRFGRELLPVQVAQAFLVNASVNAGDCDIHLEIAAVADKNAPRVIIETPVDREYCANRQSIQTILVQHGFKLDASHGGDLGTPLPIKVIGLPFEDFEHGRGSPQVATLWEIHPAIVTFQ